MPRKPREKSATDVYHCILRGINKHHIFIDNQDKYKFKNELKKYKEKYDYEIYSYCIMSNHVHLLIKDNKKNLSKIMQSLAVSYSSYFNKKYNRSGHLFENRYKSKNVESTEYILNLQRYIHRNPEKAKLCKTEEYRFSSYNDYIYDNGITDIDFILNIFNGVNRFKALTLFEKFNLTNSNEKDNIEILDYEICKKIDDDEAEIIIRDVLNIENLQEITKYNNQTIEGMINKLIQIKGISKRQIARIIGINYKVIQRMF